MALKGPKPEPKFNPKAKPGEGDAASEIAGSIIKGGREAYGKVKGFVSKITKSKTEPKVTTETTGIKTTPTATPVSIPEPIVTPTVIATPKVISIPRVKVSNTFPETIPTPRKPAVTIAKAEKLIKAHVADPARNNIELIKDLYKVSDDEASSILSTMKVEDIFPQALKDAIDTRNAAKIANAQAREAAANAAKNVRPGQAAEEAKIASDALKARDAERLLQPTPTGLPPVVEPKAPYTSKFKNKGNIIAAGGLGFNALTDAYVGEDTTQAGDSFIQNVGNVAGFLGATKLGGSAAKKIVSKKFGEDLGQSPLIYNQAASGLNKVLDTKVGQISTILAGITGLVAIGKDTYSSITSSGEVDPVENPVSALTDEPAKPVIVNNDTPATAKALTTVDVVNKARQQAYDELARATNSQAMYDAQAQAINAVYDTAIQNIKAAYQPIIDQEQAAAEQAMIQQQAAATALQTGTRAVISDLQQPTVPTSGLTPEQASAAGLSSTAVGGTNTTTGSLLRGLAGGYAAQSAADQLQLGADVNDIKSQALNAMAGDISTMEQSRSGDLIAGIRQQQKDALDLAKAKAQSDLNYWSSVNKSDLEPIDGTTGGGVTLPFGDIKPELLKLTPTQFAAYAPGFIGSPLDAQTIISTIKGQAQMGGDYTDPTTALAAWNDLYAKLYTTYAANNIPALLQALGMPTTAQGMVSILFPAGK